MKKALTGSDEKGNKKKKQRATNLGEHGFTHLKVIDGKTYYREVTAGPKLEKARCIGCSRFFKSEQGRGSREKNMCFSAIAPQRTTTRKHERLCNYRIIGIIVFGHDHHLPTSKEIKSW